MLKETPQVELGWTAADFSLPDFEGATHDKSALMGDKGLLVAFICNHCPYVKAVASQLAEDARELQSLGFGVVAINSNDFASYPDDSPPKMKLFAEHYGFTFPYLVDEDQSVARTYDAVCTPDFFGFDGSGKLQYRGRLDSSGMRSSANREPELLDAMKMVAASGKGPEEQLASMGCSIKWKR